MRNTNDTENKDNISNTNDNSHIAADILTTNFDTIAKAKEGVGKLRETILQLAVQGRLVPQDPAEEPASVLLEKIAAEKARLVKDGKIKKGKPLPPVDEDEAPYDLPDGWVWTRLGDVTNYNGRKKVAPSDLKDDYWLLELEDIEKGSSKIIQRFNCKERGAKSTKSAFKKGDVLYGKLRPYLDKVVVADSDGYCTTEIVPITSYYGIIPEYLRLFLKSPKFIEYVNSKTYGVKMPRLGTSDAINSLFSLPPLSEQHRIVERVDALMNLCDELEERQEAEAGKKQRLLLSSLGAVLDAENPEASAVAREILNDNFDLLFDDPESIAEMRKSVLQLAVQGRLVPQDAADEPASVLMKKIAAGKAKLVKEGTIKKGKPLPRVDEDEVPYDLPEGWVWTRLGDALTKLTDGTHHSPPNGSFGDYMYVSAKDIKDEGVVLSKITYVTKEIHDEIYLRCNPEKGDILYIKDGATTGIVTINNISEPFSMLSSVALMKLPESVFNRYLLYAMRSPSFYQYIRDDMTGVAITRVTLTKLSNVLIPLPPLAEQHRIVERVDVLMKLCDELEERVSARDEAAGRLVLSVCGGICG